MFEKNVENFDKHLRPYTPSDITPNKIVEGFLTNDQGKANSYLEAGSAFTFSRTRELERGFAEHMRDFLKDELIQEWIARSDINTLRNWLEEMWGCDSLESASAAAKHNFSDYKRAVPAAAPPAANSASIKLCFADGSEVDEKAVVVKAQSDAEGQVFYFVLRPQKSHDDSSSFDAGDFYHKEPKKRNASYSLTWSKVMVAHRVYESTKDIDASRTEHEYIDLTLGATTESFAYLEAKRLSAEKMIEQIENRMQTETDYLLLQALASELEDRRIEVGSLKRSISSLEGFVASKGYLLVTADDFDLQGTYKDAPKDIKTQKGKLYQRFTFVTKWIEERTIQRSKRKLFSKKKWTEIKRTPREAVDVGYREIHSQDSILAKYIDERLEGLDVFQMHLQGDGYVSDDGRSALDILTLCELDADFRARCAILMPVYKQSLFGDNIVAGYHVFRRPTRGRRVVALPALHLEETYSYRLRWIGMEIGEVISSINLLPGESRDIAIKTVRTRLREDESEVRYSAAVNETSSFETVSAIEREFSRENTSEKNKSWSVKASGSYGPFSGGGDASGSSKSTSRQFSRSLNKLTTKAVSKINKRTKQEVIDRQLTREQAEKTSSSTGQISNPNAAKTLNFFFHRVSNVHVSATYLEDFEFVYISPVELIAGSDIREIRYFRKEEFVEMLELIRDDVRSLLEGVVRIAYAQEDEDKQTQLIDKHVSEIESSMKKEVADALNDYNADSSLDIRARQDRAPVCAFAFNSGKPKKLLPDQLETAFKNSNTLGTPIEPSIVVAPSSAVYVDSVLGHNESLEGYAKTMRMLEVEKSLAEVTVTQNSLGRKRVLWNNVFHNFIWEADGKEIILKLATVPGEGAWMLLIGGIDLGVVELETGTLEYRIKPSISIADLLDMKATLVKVPANG